MASFESGDRASKRPNITLAEVAALRDHWLNIANDYEVFHENYDTRDRNINRAFSRARLPSLQELRTALDLINNLYNTVLEGTTPQRGQARIHYEYERLARLRNLLRGRFESLQVELRALGLAEPREDDEETDSHNHTISSDVVEPPSSAMAEPRSFGPNRNPPASRRNDVPIPSLAQRLNPGYRERSVSPPRNRPSQLPSHPHRQGSRPGAESEEVRRLRNEISHLHAENASLRGELADAQHDISHVVEWHKMQEEQIKARDAQIKKLKAELEKEKNKKK
ncbi:hypothetical protein N431DRAFT_440915 [Stipitochalara longipes BDJ]|nr:hypothetical protein N431DRAFT_440915 [Stipitochalara longipes BDJ]